MVGTMGVMPMPTNPKDKCFQATRLNHGPQGSANQSHSLSEQTRLDGPVCSAKQSHSIERSRADEQTRLDGLEGSANQSHPDVQARLKDGRTHQEHGQQGKLR